VSDTPLHLLPSGRWACYAKSLGPNPVMQGFCLSPEQKDILGLTWEEAQLEPWFNGYLDEAAWRRDRELRQKFYNQFHGDGHETEDEAIVCFRTYLGLFSTDELMGILAGEWNQI
jgi:hypothetical protein